MTDTRPESLVYSVVFEDVWAVRAYYAGTEGTSACGSFNARNGFGAYTGATAFIAIGSTVVLPNEPMFAGVFQGQPALAAFILTNFQIGQRPGDLREAKWGKHFFGDRFVFKQSKTGQGVKIPIPIPLRQLLEFIRVEGSEHVFNDPDRGAGFTHQRLYDRFCEVRHALSVEGEPLLQLQGLRHGCVCNLFQAGLNVAEIASITGHLLARVHTILESYFPDRLGFAETGMKKAFVANGGDPDEFGELIPLPKLDWVSDPGRLPRYKRPTITPQNVERLYPALTGQHRKRFTYDREVLGWADPEQAA